MNKKSGNFIASLVAVASICSIIGGMPVEAKTRSQKLAESNYGVARGEDTYISGVTLDKDGKISQASFQAIAKSNYLSGKDDNMDEATIISMFKSAGLTEADFYALKAQRNSSSSAVTNGAPSLKIGWAKNDSDKWYYSIDGQNWVTNNWQLVEGKWYYFDSSSQAVTGWKQIGGNWYYFDSSCAMVSNTTINGCTLGSDGILIH